MGHRGRAGREETGLLQRGIQRRKGPRACSLAWEGKRDPRGWSSRPPPPVSLADRRAPPAPTALGAHIGGTLLSPQSGKPLPSGWHAEIRLLLLALSLSCLFSTVRAGKGSKSLNYFHFEMFFHAQRILKSKVSILGSLGTKLGKSGENRFGKERP